MPGQARESPGKKDNQQEKTVKSSNVVLAMCLLNDKYYRGSSSNAVFLGPPKPALGVTRVAQEVLRSY